MVRTSCFVLLVLTAGLGGCCSSGCFSSEYAAVRCCPNQGGACAPVPAARVVSVRRVVPASGQVTVASKGGPELYDQILAKYVKGDDFDYKALKASAADRAKFKRFLDWQATADVQSMSREDQIAFYINAYNSLNIKMILEHYPVHTPMDVPGYFDKIKHPVAGESLTVAEVEYDRLIANYEDMRAHFAVVCSDRGCLPLQDHAWTGDALDEELDAAARRFVADERQFRVDPEKNEVYISKIFEWYGEKFTKDPTRPAAKPELYLLPWVDDAQREVLESGDYELKIIDWDWILNEGRKREGADDK